jgi:hypothetical protein
MFITFSMYGDFDFAIGDFGKFYERIWRGDFISKQNKRTHKWWWEVKQIAESDFGDAIRKHPLRVFKVYWYELKFHQFVTSSVRKVSSIFNIWKKNQATKYFSVDYFHFNIWLLGHYLFIKICSEPVMGFQYEPEAQFQGLLHTIPQEVSSLHRDTKGVFTKRCWFSLLNRILYYFFVISKVIPRSLLL